MMSLMFFLLLVIFSLQLTIFGFDMDKEAFIRLQDSALRNMLLSVAYSAISSVVLYATQKPSASMSVFLIL
jgi:hypothetical protein